MKIKVDTIRQAWKNAKTSFVEDWLPKQKLINNNQFWVDFGNYHGIKIEINDYMMGFPRIDEVEFDTEQHYLWFLMRWS